MDVRGEWSTPVPETTNPRSRWKRLARSGLMGLLALLVVAVPTDIIDTPLFSREVPVRWWEYPVVGATVALTAAWFAIQGPAPAARDSRRAPLGGVLLSVFAVGCPVCNKLVLLALGTSGALGVWAPLQPFLALVALALLTAAVVQRWRRRDCSSDNCSSDNCSTGSSGSDSSGSAQPVTPRQ